MVNFWVKYAERALTDRFFKHSDVLHLLSHLPSSIFSVHEAGASAENRPVNLVNAGSGNIHILLWSQMHGDEATATMALFDLFNFLVADDEFNELRNRLLSICTLHVIPMLNPDGAQRFTRRNAQGIDINRDFHKEQTPEGRLLKQLYRKIEPQFCFNLHDQSVLWSAGGTGNPATISLLAPAFDAGLSLNETRRRAMQVIACINRELQQHIPGHVARFNDEYEARAFGDNFQQAGSSTILVEAGGYPGDPEKQHVRKYFFTALLAGLTTIAENEYPAQPLENYTAIPENKKHHFHHILRNCRLTHKNIDFSADIGLIMVEQPAENGGSVTQTCVVDDFGDLGGRFGYEETEASPYSIIFTQPIAIGKPADFVLMDGNDAILCIEHGTVTVKNLY